MTIQWLFYTMAENYTHASHSLEFLYFRQVALSAKCLLLKKSFRQSARSAKRLSAKRLSAKRLSAKCLSVKMSGHHSKKRKGHFNFSTNIPQALGV